MASIYSDLISPIGPRIQVAGTRCSCSSPGTAQGARPCCWRAFAPWCCGASSAATTQIIFARKKMVELAKRF